MRVEFSKLPPKEFRLFAEQQHKKRGMHDYDYSRAEFQGTGDRDFTAIGCPTHGEVSVKTSRLVSDGRGCSHCGSEGNQRDNRERHAPEDWTLTHPPSTDHERVVEDILKHQPDYRWSFVADSYVPPSKSPNGRAYVSIDCADHGQKPIRIDEVKQYCRGCPQCVAGWEVRTRLMSRGLDQRHDLSSLEFMRNIDDIPPDDFMLFEVVDLQRKVTLSCQQKFRGGDQQGQPHGSFEVTLEKLCYSRAEANLCPCCIGSRMEKDTAAWLTKQVGSADDAAFEFIREWQVADLRLGGDNARPARFDFYLPQVGLLIELDGEQHYRPVAFGGISQTQAVLNHRETVRRDLEKNAWAREQGLTLVRIGYDDDLTARLVLDVLPRLNSRTNGEHISLDNEDSLRERYRRACEMVDALGLERP